jgi:hypothetical protein
MNHSEIVSFIRGVADLIRDTFKRGKYQDVILPLTVLRRRGPGSGPTASRSRRGNGAGDAPAVRGAGRSSRSSSPCSLSPGSGPRRLRPSAGTLE